MLIENVLIVEDELIIAKVCEKFFMQNKVREVKVVCCFNDAIQSFEENTPDLVLMDVQLKGDKDGIELAHWIRVRSEIPIVFSTGNVLKDTKNRLMNLSKTTIMTKPIKFNQLKTIMDDIENDLV